MKRMIGLALATVLSLAACSDATDATDTTAPGSAATTQEQTAAPQDAGLAKAIPAPVPEQYYLISATDDLGLASELDARKDATPKVDLVGKLFDPELRVGFVAVSKTGADYLAGLSDAEVVAPADLASVTSSSDKFDEGKNGIFAVASKYDASEVTSAVEQLTSAIEGAGAQASVEYNARVDAIRISGPLTQANLDSLPDTGVAYYFVPAAS